jgi:serine/threonine protein kinase
MGNWRYQPPEIYTEDGVLNYSSDLFTIGCILYEMITGEYPFLTKASLIAREMPARENYSEITKFICEKIFKPKHNRERIEPEELLEMVEMERGKAMFSTCKYNL